VQEALKSVMNRAGAETGTIHLLERGVLVLKAHAGIPPEIARIIALVPVGKGMAGLAVARNAPVSSCDIQSDGSGDVQARARDTGVSGAVVVPIRDGDGQAVGALGVGVARPHTYSDAEIERLCAEAGALV